MQSRTTLIWINRLLWTVLVGAVLLFASVVSLGRYYIPYVEDNRQQIVDLLNKRTGLHFSVGHLSGRWQHLSPYFVIDDLRLRNPQKPEQVILHIRHAELRLGIFRSIAARTLAISELKGDGVALQLEEAPLGRWHLPGFVSSKQIELQPLRNLLAAIYRANLSNTRINLRFFSGGSAQLDGQAMRLQRAGEFRRLNLAMTFAQGGAPVTLIIETHGDLRGNNFSVRSYAGFRGVDLTPMLPAIKTFGIELQHGRIDGEAWLDRRNNGDIEVRGNVGVPWLDIAGFGGDNFAPIKNIHAQFLWRGDERQQRIWLSQLQGQWNQTPLDFRHTTIALTKAVPQQLHLAMPELALNVLRDSLLADPQLADSIRKPLAALAPAGTLRNLHIDLPITADGKEQLRLRAQLDQIDVQPWQGAPGASGVTGYLDMGLRDGRVDLVSENFAMTFPNVYRQPLKFDGVRGQVRWLIDGEHILVNSGPMPVRGDAGTATAQFALDLPVHRASKPLMTLMVGLQNSAAQYRDLFIPYTLQPSLLDWLRQSIRGGALPSGGFIYRGSLLANDRANNTVQLFLDVHDAELKFQPDWPALHDLQAKVWVDDGDLLVESPSARMFNRVALRDINVELHHPEEGSWLTVRGSAQGSGDDVLRVLRESPLRQRVGATLDKWRWKGGAHATLDLGIPLSGTRAHQIAVDAELGPGELTLGTERIVLKDVRGPLQYRSDGGLRSDAIVAKWYDKPVTAKLITAADGNIDIQARGHIGMADLQDWLQQPLFAHANGQTPFDATLHLAGENSSLEVRSDLQGVEFTLPPPYAKQAGEVLPLHVGMALGAQRQIYAELGDKADLRLRWDDEQELDAGVLRLGRTGKNTFVTGHMLVTGRIAELDLGAWRNIFSQPQPQPQPQIGGTASSIADPALALQLRDLQIGSVAVVGQSLRDVVASAQRDATSWQIRLRSQQLAGTIRVPDDSIEPWRLQFDYVHLPAPKKADAVAAAVPSNLDQIDPSQVIAMNVRVNRLWRGGEEIGWLDLQVRPLPDGMLLQQINGSVRGVSIVPRGDTPASVRWTRRNGEHRSEFNGRLIVDDIREPLQRWRYEPVLTSKHGRADIELAWPGRPDEFKFVLAEGKAELRVDDGRFLKASSSATGALKVVGVFNFANFLRRLQLDFSDVFKNGVSFDDMRGGFVIRDGVLATAEPFEIKSPGSRFRLAGTIDFNSDQTDMELVATLPVASNLPWVAALAAGLPVAAGVYVASKVFEDQVDRFASASYAVTGPWADPQVKLRRVFDDKLPQKSNEPAQSTESSPATEQSASKEQLP